MHILMARLQEYLLLDNYTKLPSFPEKIKELKVEKFKLTKDIRENHEIFLAKLIIKFVRK